MDLIKILLPRAPGQEKKEEIKRLETVNLQQKNIWPEKM
jgi:hypothetical protein